MLSALSWPILRIAIANVNCRRNVVVGDLLQAVSWQRRAVVDTVAVTTAAQMTIVPISASLPVYSNTILSTRDVRCALHGDVGVCKHVGTGLGHQTTRRTAIP